MLAGTSAQIQIDTFRPDIRIFLMDHHARPQQRRFLGPQGFRAVNLLDVIGKREQVYLVSNVVRGECFAKKEQAVEAQSLRLRESIACRRS